MITSLCHLIAPLRHYLELWVILLCLDELSSIFLFFFHLDDLKIHDMQKYCWRFATIRLYYSSLFPAIHKTITSLCFLSYKGASIVPSKGPTHFCTNSMAFEARLILQLISVVNETKNQRFLAPKLQYAAWPWAYREIFQARWQAFLFQWFRAC
jgi:hypothetical protein